MNYYDNLIILKLKTVTCEINDDILSWFIILERINKNLITVFEKKIQNDNKRLLHTKYCLISVLYICICFNLFPHVNLLLSTNGFGFFYIVCDVI